MSLTDTPRHSESATDYPATWDLDSLQQKMLNHMQSLLEDNESPIPLKRLQYQLEQSTIYHDVIQRWPRMDDNQRLKAWKLLLEYSDQVARDTLPTCVQCGVCCRRGSPTLHLEDLELLKQGKLPFNKILTLRQGEPVHSPFDGKIFFLLDERIKIQEKPRTQECVFLDGDDCTIYVDRPLQCRAQACWDSAQYEELTQQPYLTRRDLFAEVETLVELMNEHNKRCSFSKLQELFKQLAERGEEGIQPLFELLGYEDHFRRFFGEQLKIPEDVLQLVFGRSLADLVALFGFRVEQEPDGTRRLVPDPAQ